MNIARRFSTTASKFATYRSGAFNLGAMPLATKRAPSLKPDTIKAARPSYASSSSPKIPWKPKSEASKEAEKSVVPEPAQEAVKISAEEEFAAVPNSGSYVAPIRDSSYTTSRNDAQTVADMTNSIKMVEETENLNEDWSTSFGGLGSKPFSQQAGDILMAPVEPNDVEITPDGLLYLPEIKYRRILNRAFGPGGWGIAPRTKTLVTTKQVTREYGLVCLGRLVSVSRGEQEYFSEFGVTTAMEGCKSNALMRCCKDLGIASELWDPAFIRIFKAKYCDSKYFEKKKRYVWKLKSRVWDYPYNK